VLRFLDIFFSWLWIWRRLRGGHWECWQVDHPVCGETWERTTRDECYRLTGKHPGGLIRGNPYCEEKGKVAFDTAVYCKCGRDLSRAPGVAGAHEGDPKTSAIYGYSCPCGRWPRFLWGFGWEYLGDSRDEDQQEAQTEIRNMRAEMAVKLEPLVSRDWIMKNVLNLSDDEVDQVEQQHGQA
jgi:hypothetical protein